jgi:ribulose-phosphate 3-epimerase
VNKTTWTAAICFANIARLGEDVAVLEGHGCSEIHIDISDGNFAPGFSLGYETIRSLKSVTSLPLHAHLMVQNPERHLQDCAEAGCTRITIHAEASTHSHRALQNIKQLGLEAGVAIKPGSPLTKLEYLIADADYIHIITEDRGVARNIPVPAAFERIKILRSNLDYQESRAKIVVEGYMTPKNAALAIVQGADTIVWDDAAVFAEGDLAENIKAFLEQVVVEQKIT